MKKEFKTHSNEKELNKTIYNNNNFIKKEKKRKEKKCRRKYSKRI